MVSGRLRNGFCARGAKENRKECFRVGEKSVSCATQLAYSMTSRLRHVRYHHVHCGENREYIYIYKRFRLRRRFHKFPGFKRRHFVTAAFPNGSLTKGFDVYTRTKVYTPAEKVARWFFRVNFLMRCIYKYYVDNVWKYGGKEFRKI